MHGASEERRREARRGDAERRPAAPAAQPAPERGTDDVLRLQRGLGNRAVARMLLQRNGSDDEGDPQPSKKRKRAPSATMTVNETREALKGVTRGTGHGGPGFWTPGITVRGAQPFAGRERQQLLRHLSTQLYHVVRKHLEHEQLDSSFGEQEVQTMFVNGRFVVATNAGTSVDALARELAAAVERYKSEDAEMLVEGASSSGGPAPEPVHPLQDMLESVHAEDDDRERTVAGKMHQVFAGARDARLTGLAEAETLKAMVKSEDFYAVVDVSSDAGCAEAVADEKHKAKVVFVKHSEFPHAEQKLVWALYRTNTTGISIYGKKRPCAMCTAVLSFASDALGLNIGFNPNPGGLWKAASAGFRFLANHAIGEGSVSVQEVRDWLMGYAAKFGGDDPELHMYMAHSLGVAGRKDVVDTDERFGPADKLPRGDPAYDSGSDTEVEDAVLSGLRRYAPVTRPDMPSEKMRKKPKKKKEPKAGGDGTQPRPRKRRRKGEADEQVSVPGGYDADNE